MEGTLCLKNYLHQILRISARGVNFSDFLGLRLLRSSCCSNRGFTNQTSNFMSSCCFYRTSRPVCGHRSKPSSGNNQTVLVLKPCNSREVSYVPRKGFHVTCVSQHFMDLRDKDHEKKSKDLVVQQGQYFDEAQKCKDKQTFHDALKLYIKRNEVHRRGHVEFIYAALDHMKDFKVHRDLETYKKILDLFPRYKMIPKNAWQVEMMHYPKQQQCCIDVLDFMEDNGVIPDDDMGYQLLKIFGPDAHAFRKYRRMMYWMPKFRFANPYYVPFELPTDDLELACLAVKRMSVDLESVVSVFKTEELENAVDKTYIVSGQSPTQRRLIEELPRRGRDRQQPSFVEGGPAEQPVFVEGGPAEQPVFVEGGYTVWLRSKSLTYFILRAECTERYKKFKAKPNDSDEEMFNWTIFTGESPKELAIPPSDHEQEDGTVLAMCITGTASKDSLVSWIRFLERTNPALTKIPVVFKLKSPGTDIEKIMDEPLRKKSELI